MPKNVRVLYTPFEGKKQMFDNASAACTALGLKYESVVVKFKRQEKDGRKQLHLWEDGKLEVIE